LARCERPPGLGDDAVVVLGRQAGRQARSPRARPARKNVKKKKLKSMWPTHIRVVHWPGQNHNQDVIPMYVRGCGKQVRQVASTRTLSGPRWSVSSETATALQKPGVTKLPGLGTHSAKLLVPAALAAVKAPSKRESEHAQAAVASSADRWRSARTQEAFSGPEKRR
jgi:hypothetical protein